MKLHKSSENSVTLVQNRFIDDYMSAANGEFVKVYLYLLRCSSGDRELSLSSIADALNHTESDVQRALSYWEKQHLLQLTRDASGVPTDLVFTDGDALRQDSQNRVQQYAFGLQRIAQEPFSDSSGSVTAGIAAGFDGSLPTREEPYQTQPPVSDAAGAEFARDADGRTSTAGQTPRIHISADRRRELSSQEEVKQLLYIAEQYLARQLSSTDVNHILYFYDELHFSADLIEYLIEYCVSRGKKSIHYIRSVALGWAADGVSTVEEARRDSNLYRKEFYTILNAFGIQDRGPAQAEIDYMTRWYEELGCSTELILEACSRTITRIHTPSFPYADSILQEWKNRGVRQVSDIEKLDPAPKEEPPHKSRVRSGRTSAKSAANYGFKQRDYDYKKLEQQLLDC